MSNKVSLEEFLEDTNSHCYRCIKNPGESLAPDVRNKIKRTIKTRLGRPMDNEEYKIFQVFTGLKQEITTHGGVRVHVGTSERGMIHTLERHFRENGDKNGGRVDYLDIIKIPHILNTVTPVPVPNCPQQTHVYTHAEDEKTYIMVKYKFNHKWYIKTIYTKDIS